MERFVKGDVVIAPFPYSDLSTTKKRPALVIASLTGDDIILCQITSQTIADEYAIQLTAGDFSTGKLRQISNIRPNRLFTADGSIISYRAGTVTRKKSEEVIAKIIKILQGDEASKLKHQRR